MARATDASGEQLTLGPRHGAEDGAGRRALEAYLESDAHRSSGPAPRRKRVIDYPRQGRRGWTRWVPSWRLVLSLVLLVIAAVTGVILYLYTTTELPTRENTDATFRATIVYDAQGHELGRFAAQNRVYVRLDQVPRRVRDAVLSAEDRTFYSNQGVSFASVVRAALNNVRGGATQGGSTITQQYVKNAYSSTTDRSYTRKLHEFFVSLKAARELSKDQILEDYLNIIYFGRGCYGIEAAAECYFGKHVNQLTVSEAAYLAGIINGPELYDSGTSQARAGARARWGYVLDGMVTEGWLPAGQRAKAVFPKIKPRALTAPGSSLSGQQTYAMQMVRAEAARLGISDSELQRDGYKIYTTFRAGLVKDATSAVSSVLGPRRTWPAGTQVAIATVDAKTGAVVSIYGGDGERSQNAVTQDIVQAGSTFKPFGLVAALEGRRDLGDCTPKAPDADSLSLRSRFDGQSPQTFGTFKVTNFGNEQYGNIDLVTATAESVNTVYVGLNEKVGPQHTMDVAVCAGYPKTTRDLLANPANVLGTSAPHPIDVARAFATFAAQGVRHDTYVISKIVNSENDAVVALHDPTSGQAVFDPGVMADATAAMQAVVEHGTATTVSRLGRPVAGKTGTTSDNKSAWFAGYTPQYATVVAMYRMGKKGGQSSLEPWAGAGSEVTGGTLPARVWTEYMSSVLQGLPVADFPQPSYGGQSGDTAPSTSTSVPPPSPTPEAPQPSAPSPSPSVGQPSPSEPAPSPTQTPGPTATAPPFPTPPSRRRPGPTPPPLTSPTQ